ncbi:probable LRR receptor-like serine/threonine-protein kinase At5g59680 [Salvia miltiorrhiza]|uniref:probable LRR receptor-like serine/threonine-protein kinase At5g59680 n=1 Tax=Salvia miltiorrhiza TaxID=226208 RepID=UPI0025AB881F|nr:probable LRR receptor-like serine/threonine-protein kinase At5g59680 [Salvia miltiorrhiza]
MAMAAHRFFPYLLLTLCSLPLLSADVFLSIDCGASTSYKDESGIVWTGDSLYAANGESRSVASSNSFSRVMDTMRVFTTGRRNCYNINTGATRGRLLVRAHFFYGNYDGKSSPPTFDLSFDGNDWATVETSSTESYYYEVIYVSKKDSMSVCVAQTVTGQFPFVSAITVRSLELFSYNNIDFNHPLYMSRRVAFGSNTTIRWPDDPYDRYWSPSVYENGTIRVSNTAPLGDSIFLEDRPPPAVLKNAVTAITPRSTIDLFMRFPSRQAPVYINWYFSEVAVLARNQIRAFRVFKDDLPYSPPILPPYGNCTQFSVSNLLASSGNTFSLVPTNYSTLPPLINAMEVFYIGDALTDGTNARDVRGLASLQTTFSMLRNWSGDPCLPSPFSWDWIVCNTNLVPRVTTLSLVGYGLSGFLPDFSSMDALRKIDLSNNNLQGPIPEFLGTLPNLEILNLGNNQFSGTIPRSLSRKTGLILTVDGNPGLCTTCSTPSTSNSSAERKHKKVLETLFTTIISSIVILKLGESGVRVLV